MDQCPDCDAHELNRFTRRQFVRPVGPTTVAAAAPAIWPDSARSDDRPQTTPDMLVKKRFELPTPRQREVVRCNWDDGDDSMGRHSSGATRVRRECLSGAMPLTTGQ